MVRIWNLVVGKVDTNSVLNEHLQRKGGKKKKNPLIDWEGEKKTGIQYIH